MLGIKAKIVRFVSNDQLGIVECRFQDAWGKEHIIEEKIPVITEMPLDENSQYPQDVVIACELIAEWTDGAGKRIFKVSTDRPHGTSTNDGLTEFDLDSQYMIII